MLRLYTACVFVVFVVMMRCLIHAADEGNAAAPPLQSLESDTQTRERGSYSDHIFSLNYDEIQVASKGWKKHPIRAKIMPNVFKYGVLLYNAIYTPLKMKPLMSEANVFAKRVINGQDYFKSRCGSAGKVTGFNICSIDTIVLESMSLLASASGAINEAYIRTRLNTSIETFRNLTNGVLLLTKAINTELMMVEHILKMSVKFMSALVVRYLHGPVPVPGTGKYFVKACDNLYAAISDHNLMSGMIMKHWLTTITDHIYPETVELANQFVQSFPYALEKGVPAVYQDSPFPPLSYYWDMNALEDAVAVLTDVNIIAKQALSDLEDENAEDIFHNKALISNIHIGAVTGLNDTASHLKKDEVKAALEAATMGVRTAVYAYHEAGLDIPDEHGSEVLMENIHSFLRTLRSTIERSNMNPMKLQSGSKVGSGFGIGGTNLHVNYGGLKDLLNFLPQDSNSLVLMVAQTSDSFMKHYTNIFSSGSSSSVNLDEFKPRIPSIPSKDLDDVDVEGEDDEPDLPDELPVQPFPWSDMKDQMYILKLLGINETMITELQAIVYKHATLEFILKMQNPSACAADPRCRDTHINIVTEIWKKLGMEVDEPDLPDELVIKPFSWRDLKDQMYMLKLLGINETMLKELMPIVFKHATPEFILKIQNPSACAADPRCREIHINIATEIGKKLGIEGDEPDLPDELLIKPFPWRDLKYQMYMLKLLGINETMVTELQAIVNKHATPEYLKKMQNPSACVADPRCREIHINIANEMGKKLGVDMPTGFKPRHI